MQSSRRSWKQVSSRRSMVGKKTFQELCRLDGWKRIDFWAVSFCFTLSWSWVAWQHACTMSWQHAGNSFSRFLLLHCCPILQWNKQVWAVLLHPKSFLDILLILYIWIFAGIPEILLSVWPALELLWPLHTWLFFIRVEASELGFSCLHDKHYTDWASS